MSKETKSNVGDVAPAAEPTVKTAEEWAKELAVPEWKFAAAKALAKLPFGRELSKDGFDKLMADVDKVVCR